MNPEDVLRMIDVIHRDKDIPKEVIFRGLEEALAAGVRKRLGVGEDLVVRIDRQSGEITMEDAEEEYEYFRAICAGDLITVTHAIADIYDKKTPTGALVFVVIETRGNDAKDRPVFKGRRVLVELKRD